jgi:hypothetical protein
VISCYAFDYCILQHFRSIIRRWLIYQYKPLCHKRSDSYASGVGRRKTDGPSHEIEYAFYWSWHYRQLQRLALLFHVERSLLPCHSPTQQLSIPISHQDCCALPPRKKTSLWTRNTKKSDNSGWYTSSSQSSFACHACGHGYLA